MDERKFPNEVFFKFDENMKLVGGSGEMSAFNQLETLAFRSGASIVRLQGAIYNKIQDEAAVEKDDMHTKPLYARNLTYRLLAQSSSDQ